jgi:hypothetical protein
MESKKQDIFSRLTDTSKYTGAHKQRFNEDGTGKGKAGREDIVKYNYSKPIKSKDDHHLDIDISDKTSKLKISEEEKSEKKISKSPQITSTGISDKKKMPGIFDRLTDTSKYTGAHKERFNADGTGKGKVGRVDASDKKELSNMVKKK